MTLVLFPQMKAASCLLVFKILAFYFKNNPLILQFYEVYLCSQMTLSPVVLFILGDLEFLKYSLESLIAGGYLNTAVGLVLKS